MKAAVVRGRGHIQVEAVPEPIPGAYDALVQILGCGVCTGTDQHILQGGFPWVAPYPFLLRHQSICRVFGVWPNGRYFKAGALIFRPPAGPPRSKPPPPSPVFSPLPPLPP